MPDNNDDRYPIFLLVAIALIGLFFGWCFFYVKGFAYDLEVGNYDFNGFDSNADPTFEDFMNNAYQSLVSQGAPEDYIANVLITYFLKPAGYSEEYIEQFRIKVQTTQNGEDYFVQNLLPNIDEKYRTWVMNNLKYFKYGQKIYMGPPDDIKECYCLGYYELTQEYKDAIANYWNRSNEHLIFYYTEPEHWEKYYSKYNSLEEYCQKLSEPWYSDWIPDEPIYYNPDHIIGFCDWNLDDAGYQIGETISFTAPSDPEEELPYYVISEEIDNALFSDEELNNLPDELRTMSKGLIAVVDNQKELQKKIDELNKVTSDHKEITDLSYQAQLDQIENENKTIFEKKLNEYSVKDTILLVLVSASLIGAIVFMIFKFTPKIGR